ncbi:MAG: DUF429 domain-containing protein [Candidatus Abyssubacteria bacterium]
MKLITVLGLDLAGSPRRPTGICLLKGLRASTKIAYSDEEILAAATPDIRLVAIDAPLSLPAGRCCLRDDCACAGKAHFRQCDLDLRGHGIRFFPITLGPMRMLTERGMRLKEELERRGLEVVETYAGGAQDILGMPRQKDPAGLRRALKRYGIRGDVERESITRDELDAVTCALVARLHVKGKHFALGISTEGQIILPRPDAQRGDS